MPKSERRRDSASDRRHKHSRKSQLCVKNEPSGESSAGKTTTHRQYHRPLTPDTSPIRLLPFSPSQVKCHCLSGALFNVEWLLCSCYDADILCLQKFSRWDCTYKTRQTSVPEYLSRHITTRSSTRSLRSSSAPLLHVPFRRTSFDKRSFSTAAPSVWNSLPVSVQNCDTLTLFKSRLKAHLFSSVYAS